LLIKGGLAEPVTNNPWADGHCCVAKSCCVFGVATNGAAA
jgi:hypothetical protein